MVTKQNSTFLVASLFVLGIAVSACSSTTPLPDGTQSGSDSTVIRNEAGVIITPDGQVKVGDGCIPNCAGKCKDQADGCGGKCATNTCTTCCISASGFQTCAKTGTSNGACGSGGAACEKCSSLSPPKACDPTTKTCSGVCVPDCKEKCAGQSDECGGKCAANTCTGCCNANKVCDFGTGDVSCGKNGEACIQCNDSGRKCDTTKKECYMPS